MNSRIIREVDSTLAQISAREEERLIQSILSANRLFIAGAGRSGLMMRAFAMRLTQLGLKTCVVGETTTTNITPGDLLLIGSGSGTTGSLTLMAQRTKALGTGLALITIFPASPIGKIADTVVHIPAPRPQIDIFAEQENTFISQQPMGSLFEQSLFLFLESVVLELMERTNMDAQKMYARHANLE